MQKILFNKIIENISYGQKEKIDFDYGKYLGYIEEIKHKINYNEKIYIENETNFDLAEISILFWGLLALYTGKIKNDEKIGIILQSLSTQISNNILTLVILCNESLDFQCGLIMCSTIELCFTLLVLLLNNDKREKFFDAIKNNNESYTWYKEFRLKDIIKELEKHEKVIFNDDLSIEKEINSNRKAIYEYYSKYTHNTFFMCYSNSYTMPKNVESSDEMLQYNLWGIYSSRVRKFLDEVNQLSFITILEFINFFAVEDYINDEMSELWCDISIFYLMYKELYLKHTKDQENNN